MDSVLRPRDIQARIRSGESPETVAAVAQTSLDKIMVFATPVLAERAYVAQQAQRASVRRRAGEGPVGHLGEAVAERLSSAGVDAGAVEWDSWRRPDGRWTLVAQYADGGEPHTARFVFDVAGRYVVAEDDEARRLVGERFATAGDGSPAGPAAVTEHGDGQLGLGDDAIELVTGRRPHPVETAPGEAGPVETHADAVQAAPVGAAPVGAAPVGADAEPTVDLSAAAEAVRNRPQPRAAAGWMATQATERPAAAPEAQAPAVPEADGPEAGASEPEALFEAAEVAPAQQPPASPGPADPDSSDPDSSAPDASPEQPRKPRRSGRSKGRASVPSWDEIMFGSGRNTD